MLQSIRDRAQGWVAYVIVFLISIPFALWGINEYTGGGRESAVAKVGDQEITERALDMSLNNARINLRQQFGGQIPALFTDEILRAQVLDSMINEELLNQKTVDLKVRAGDLMVSEEIRSIEAFQRNGVFDLEAYKQALRVRGSSEKGFVEQIRASLGTELVRRSISGSEPVTESEIDAMLKLKNQKRVASWLTIDAAQVKDIPEVTDADIETYYNENKEKYPKPEQVRIEYVELNADTIGKSIAIDEKEIRAYYDDPEKQKQFISEEKRNMRHILLKVDANRSDEDAKKEAERILGELKAGGDFAELAKQYSEDTGSGSRGGDLGLVKKGAMVKPFEEAGFALEKDQISELVRSRFGYHIIQVTGIEGGDIQPFEEVKEQIAGELKREEAKKLFADKYDQLGNLAYATPDSLKPAAEAIGIQVLQSDWIPKTGGIGELSNPKIINTVFSPDAFENRLNSEILELSVDNYVVVRVTDYEPQTIKPLEEVKLAIRNTLEADNRKNLAANKAKALLEEISGGKSIDELASAGEYKLEKEKEIGRDGKDVPTQVRDKAFGMIAGETAKWETTELAAGSFAIVGLHSVTNGDPAAVTKEERDALRQQIAASRGRTILQGYVKQLRQEFGVSMIEN
jgi:peptidyl-prolyl cis-trans isomerase D